MRILIAGGGRTGATLALTLHAQKHEVRLMEHRPSVLAHIHRELPTELIYEGNPNDPRTLEFARIADAQVLVASMSSDAENLSLCFIAREHFKVPRTIATINDPRFAWLFGPRFHVDVAVNQADILASLIEQELSVGRHDDAPEAAQGQLLARERDPGGRRPGRGADPARAGVPAQRGRLRDPAEERRRDPPRRRPASRRETRCWPWSTRPRRWSWRRCFGAGAGPRGRSRPVPGRGSVSSFAPRMLDRVPAAPVTAGPIRLLAVYRSAASLLRELSRALNQGQTLLKADTGLPAGTRLVLVMTTDALSAPIEVYGVVTACRSRAGRLAMTLRYDFDPEPHRSRLREALAELRRETRKPRREARVPLALRADAAALLRGLSATVSDASRAGARLELVGRAPARGGLGRPAGDDARRQPPRQPPARPARARGDVGRRPAPVGARAAAGSGGPFRRALPGPQAANRGHPPLRRRAAGVAARPDRAAGEASGKRR